MAEIAKDDLRERLGNIDQIRDIILGLTSGNSRIGLNGWKPRWPTSIKKCAIAMRICENILPAS
ncbi:MAG: hypothetical protein HC918_10000 [Oscillatoriales cyanobacterium SM2_1_8]|nr:hypothetical protein [Oscillatoriales cyanobacterium SM2_1_8]